ncbi:MAG: hypothetical protein JJT90_15530 [Ectothiorhodospiraceae bacterium]|nr:hypothetical protein [Ectothiorhodospiraceae bacterium]
MREEDFRHSLDELQNLMRGEGELAGDKADKALQHLNAIDAWVFAHLRDTRPTTTSPGTVAQGGGMPAQPVSGRITCPECHKTFVVALNQATGIADNKP